MDDLHPTDGALGRAAEAVGNRAVYDDRRDWFADTASVIPRRGWKDILLRVWSGVFGDRILASAAAVAFYTLLALFPAIAALVSIYGLFSDPTTIARQLDALSGIMPGGAVQVIGDQLTRVTQNRNATLGIGFAVGLLVSLWSTNGGVKAMFDALNTAHQEKEERGIIKLNLVSLAFTIAMILFAVIAIACLVALPAVLRYLPVFVATILDIGRWPVLAVLIALGLACLYRFGPSRREPCWRWISWGSAFAAVGWLVVSALFSYYAANFGTFNQTYGSLGAVIGFMLWIWLSVIVILLGAKLDAEIERQTAGG
jgi:membrane protein